MGKARERNDRHIERERRTSAERERKIEREREIERKRQQEYNACVRNLRTTPILTPPHQEALGVKRPFSGQLLQPAFSERSFCDWGGPHAPDCASPQNLGREWRSKRHLGEQGPGV